MSQIWHTLGVKFQSKDLVCVKKLTFCNSGSQVDEFMKQQGCESTERGKFVNKCLVDGGHTEGNRSEWPCFNSTFNSKLVDGGPTEGNRSDCDIRKNFNANDYPNIFVKLIWWMAAIPRATGPILNLLN